jgi:hypothetical protein
MRSKCSGGIESIPPEKKIEARQPIPPTYSARSTLWISVMKRMLGISKMIAITEANCMLYPLDE